MTVRVGRVRYRVLAMTVALAFITYLDRVCIAVTAPDISRELHLSTLQMSFVFSAFTAAYALFEIPTGWWADRDGTRRVLTRIVVWWSVFTAATGLAWNFSSLLAARALFGCGEAGAWPSVARTLSRWFPFKERGTAQGVFFMGAHLGGGLTPLLVAFIVRQLGWRATFPALSVFGFAWALAWFLWFRDEPEQHAAVGETERNYIESGRQLSGGHGGGINFSAMVASPSVWFLCLMYLTQTYGSVLYVTWLPTYLAHDKKLVGTALSFFAGLPLLLSVAADLAGGITTDALTRRMGLRAGRCLVGAASLGLAAGFLFAGARASGVTAAILIAIAAAMSNFLLGAAWGTCVDLAGTSAGVVSAAMNTSGQVGGVLSPIAFALLTKGQTSWNFPIYLTAVLYVIGAACWCFVHPEHRLSSRIETSEG